MGDLEKATRKAQEFRQREQEILDAALILFLEQGEDRVTVENIADRVGIGKGTIYKHFETKNQIYLLLMLRYEEDLASLFQDISESDDKETLAREANFEKLNHIVEARIQEGSLEPVPAIYHICSAWALAHGAVALMQSPFYQRLIEDKDDFLDFLIEIGIRMGNKGQRGK